MESVPNGAHCIVSQIGYKGGSVIFILSIIVGKDSLIDIDYDIYFLYSFLIEFRYLCPVSPKSHIR